MIMTRKPFFSIVIPTYNRSADLRFALFCILRQSFSDYEIVVSDNCSTDDTEDVVKKFHNKKICYFRNPENLLIDLSQRKAVERAKGTYVFLHGDDDFLPYSNTLEIVYKEIVEHTLGYVRINYLSLSLDKKRIFSFGTKQFINNEYLPTHATNDRVISFIIDSSHCFITGIVFKNVLPRHIRMINADPCPWIDILFYVTKNFGACIIAQPHVVASWSRREIAPNVEHHLFTLASGTLKSQNYFNALSRILSKQAYKKILHNQLMGIYVLLFPIIKINVGNRLTLQIASRIRSLDPTMSRDLRYWLYLFISLVFPRSLLRAARDMYLYMYTLVSKAEHNDEIVKTLKGLEREYE